MFAAPNAALRNPDHDAIPLRMNHLPAYPYSNSSSMGSGQKANIGLCESVGYRNEFVPYFPSPEPGETLYSICARFHRLSGGLDPDATSLLLLGSRRGGARQDHIFGLTRLAAASGGLIAADESVLRERTVLRAYLPFMAADKRQAVIHTICLSQYRKPPSRAQTGLTWNSITLTHELRACPQCLLQQRQHLGFGFWRSAHQLPGVWMCAEHQEILRTVPKRGPRNAGWVTARDEILVTALELFDNSDRQILGRIADSVHWLADFARVNLDALTLMVRSRLHECGFTPSAFSLSAKDLASIATECRNRLGRFRAGHFDFVHSPLWLGQVLFDRRASHPVRWAVLLAITGHTDRKTLSEQYISSLHRLPDLELFPRPQTFRARAPGYLYDALSGPVTIAEAAIKAGVKRSQVESWLRRDRLLGEHWRRTRAEVKRRAARFVIQGAVAALPQASRSEIIARCLWAVRWLEANCASDLNEVLPPRKPEFDRQLSLDFSGEVLH